MDTVIPQLLPAQTEVKLPKLNRKQRKFVTVYLATNNQTEAAIQCGYSPRSAAVLGSRMVKNGTVRAHIEAALRADGLSPGQIIKAYSDQAKASIGELIDDSGAFKIEAIKANGHLIDSWSPGNAKLPAKVKLSSRQHALDQLARIHGMIDGDSARVQVNVALFVNGQPQGV